MMRRWLLGALLALLLPSVALAQLVPPTRTLAYTLLEGLSAGGGDVVVADDPDAVLWFAAVGTVGAAQRARVNTLFAALKAAGSFAKADDYWLLVAENTTQALTSLKQRRLAVAVASPVFAVGLGYTFDVTLAPYIDTGFIPFTHATVSTGDSIRFAVYLRAPDGLATGGFVAGSRVSGGRSIRLRPLPASFLPDTNDVNTAFALPGGATGSKGYAAGSRSDATVASKKAYLNGVPLVRTVDATATSAIASNLSIYIGGVNLNGVMSQPTTCTLGFLTHGAPLTDPQELAEYQAIQAYMVAWGAGV
jgi:hypothetical protein